MMKGLCSLVLIAVAGLLPFGCARKAATKPAPRAKPTAQGKMTLPDWAPKHPSPEFMRAWRVLRPTPKEEFTKFGEGDPERLALAEHASRTWAAAYEFFGTLTDAQMKQFFAERFIRMPVKSLSEKQRAALDGWFASWRRQMRGQSGIPADLVVMLYKMGAQPDLSNVDVGFGAQSKGRRVHTRLWVRGTDGKDSSFANDFAYM